MKKQATNNTTLGNAYITSGSCYQKLAIDTAKIMNAPFLPVETKTFSNSERYVRFNESVRGKHIFIIQSLIATQGSSVNDYLMELILLIDAAKRSSASEITVIIPYFAYSRQDRKARGREPISSAILSQIIQQAGANRIVSVDLHSPQIQASFSGPFDHLVAESLICDALEKQMKSKNKMSYVVVSPDVGGSKTAETFANRLGIDVVVMTKKRDRNNPSKIVHSSSVPGIKDRVCIVIDDMIDTAGTLVSAINIMKKSGAKQILACTTHGIFSGEACERLKSSPIDKLFSTDTLPQNSIKEVMGNRFKLIPIAPLLGEALRRVASGESVSYIFHDNNYK